MAEDTIYILHKNGANSHYAGLKYLLEQQQISLRYREFSIFSNFFKSITKLNIKLFIKQWVNLGFMLKLIVTKNTKIVLGIAPFDNKLVRLSKILNNHKIYYHTSWSCWDGSFQPKSKENTPKVKTTWKKFIETQSQHIFCVSQKSQSQIIENYSVNPAKVSVVYHAIDKAYFSTNTSVNKEKLSFIYVGRLVPQKGIEELVQYFSKQTKASLSILGSGSLQNLVEDYAQTHTNINYYPYTNNKETIARLIAQHEYFVLNAKKTEKWEELFGLALIESMAQGTVPIASKHTGPQEIIGTENGCLFEEGEIIQTLNHIIEKPISSTNLKDSIKRNARLYSVEHISELWKPILK